MGYPFDKDFIETAVFIISTGKANRLVKDNMTIYAVGDNLIRIDVRRAEAVEK